MNQENKLYLRGKFPLRVKTCNFCCNLQLCGAAMLNHGSYVHQHPRTMHVNLSIFFRSVEYYFCLFFLEEEWNDPFCSSVDQIVDKSLSSSNIFLKVFCTAMEIENLFGRVKNVHSYNGTTFFFFHLDFQHHSHLIQ